jgi:hypothetical protein
MIGNGSYRHSSSKNEILFPKLEDTTFSTASWTLNECESKNERLGERR